MRRIVPHRKNAAMNIRVQRLYAPVHNLRKSRHVADIEHGNSRLLQRAHSAAGRNDFDARRVQLPRKFHDSRLIRNADQCPLDFHKRALQFIYCKIRTFRPSIFNLPFKNNSIAFGYSLCSCSNTRAASVSSSSLSNTGTAVCKIIGPESIPSSTK